MFSIIFEYLYYVMPYKSRHSSGLTPPQPAQICYCTVFRAILIISRHVCVWPLPFSKESEFNCLPENWTPNISPHLRTLLATYKTVFILALQDTKCWYIPVAVHDILSPAPLLHVLFCPNGRQFNLPFLHPSPLPSSSFRFCKHPIAPSCKTRFYLPMNFLLPPGLTPCYLASPLLSSTTTPQARRRQARGRARPLTPKNSPQLFFFGVSHITVFLKLQFSPSPPSMNPMPTRTQFLRRHFRLFKKDSLQAFWVHTFVSWFLNKILTTMHSSTLFKKELTSQTFSSSRR